MLHPLLRRGRHTTATTLCCIFSVSVSSLTAQIVGTPGPPTPIAVNPLPLIPPGTVLTPDMIALLGGKTTTAPTPTNTNLTTTVMPGKGVDIAASANGTVWLIGIGDYAVWQWNGQKFVKMPNLDPTNASLGASRIAVTPDGTAWVIDRTAHIWSFDTSKRVWVKNSGVAADIGIGSDGVVWTVNDQSAVQKWTGTAWQAAGTIPETGAKRIAVDAAGSPWVICPSATYRLVNGVFQKMGFGGYDIAIGGDGAVWIAATETGGAGHLQWWNGEKLVQFNGAMATHLAVDGVGAGYSIDASQTIYRFSLPGPNPAPQGIKSGNWMNFLMKGKLACMATVEPNDCGRQPANWVGKHEVTMKCDSGFYDPIYGGTCWTCPTDDGSGPWIRSLDPVTSSTACWRSPKETLTSANKVKSPGWAWECPSGSFWDGYSPDGAGGSCWSCPDHHPRRTGFPIYDNRACASAINETDNAIQVGYSGCPKPDRDAMSLTGLKQPGQPFLDVGAGGCYACPVVDKDGTFLIPVRNGVALYSQDAESTLAYTSTKTLKQGCDISFRYTPTPFTQPGISGLNGALELLLETRLLEYPDLMTGALYSIAEARGYTGAKATTYVTTAWTQIGTDPLGSEGLRSVLYLLLQGAVKKDASLRTQAERMLIDSFGRYIVTRRTYYAQQGLDMYDSWKAGMDAFQSSIAKSPIQQAFGYGIVPLDFKGTLLSIAGGVGAAGMTYLGSVAAYNIREAAYNAAMDKIDDATVLKKPNQVPIDGVTTEERTFEKIPKTARLSKPSVTNLSVFNKVIQAIRGLSTAGTMLLTGGILVEIGVSILAGIAAAQLIQIESARPDLVAMLANAQQPIDVPTLMSTDSGRAAAALYWAQAMEAGEAPIPALTTMAQAACQWVAGRNYQRPKGI